jgi:hypothetical protein
MGLWERGNTRSDGGWRDEGWRRWEHCNHYSGPMIFSRGLAMVHYHLWTDLTGFHLICPNDIVCHWHLSYKSFTCIILKATMYLFTLHQFGSSIFLGGWEHHISSQLHEPDLLNTSHPTTLLTYSLCSLL